MTTLPLVHYLRRTRMPAARRIRFSSSSRFLEGARLLTVPRPALTFERFPVLMATAF